MLKAASWLPSSSPHNHRTGACLWLRRTGKGQTRPVFSVTSALTRRRILLPQEDPWRKRVLCSYMDVPPVAPRVAATGVGRGARVVLPLSPWTLHSIPARLLDHFCSAGGQGRTVWCYCQGSGGHGTGSARASQSLVVWIRRGARCQGNIITYSPPRNARLRQVAFVW